MSLKVNFSLMTAGRFVFVLCQWLLLVVIGRLADPDALGRFTYALALTSPLIVFTQFNMQAYMATDTKNEFGFADYRNARILGVVAALAAIVLLSLLRDKTASWWLIVVLVGLYKSFESVSDIYYGALQKRGAFLDISASVALHGVLAVAGLMLALWWTGDLRIAVGAVAMAWLALLVLFDVPRAHAAMATEPLPAGGGRALEAIRACFPFGLTLSLMTLRINVPVYFIEAELGLEQVGYYSAVAYFIVAGRIVIGALVQTSAPRLAGYFNDGDLAGFRHLLGKLMVLAILLGLAGLAVAALLGAFVLGLAYGPGYAAYAPLLVVIMLVAAATYFTQLTGMCLTIARYRQMLIFSNLAGTATVVLCAAVLVPRFGLHGGAFALLASTLVIVLINARTIAHALAARTREIACTPRC